MYAYRTEEHDPLLTTLLAGTPVCDGVNLNVAEHDEMLGVLHHLRGERGPALVMYFNSGLFIWSALRRALEWRFGELAKVGRLLDFASGWGRVTRFLVRDLPPERVWVSDIDAAAVRFQERELGVHGVISAASPAGFTPAERFDAILVSSLFTHLPEATFEPWLARLWSLLAPGGLLLFSVHDRILVPPGRELPPGGLLFDEISESASLDRAGYGTTWVDETFVRLAIGRVAPRASAHRVPKGLANFQDLWIVVDEPDVSFAGLGLRAGAEGHIDRCALVAPRRLEVSGWAVDRVVGEPPAEVRAVVGGEVLAVTRELPPREDAAPLYLPVERVRPISFHLVLDLPPGTPGAAPLKVRAVDGQGHESAIFTSTVDGALLRSARIDLMLFPMVERARAAAEARVAELERLVDRLRSDVEELRARADHEQAAHEAVLAAMRASRFWKLRNAWFAVKRRLRLTDEV